ncbi:MAG: YggS family pyridoxal phosphate-dependent enzyme [Leptospiraceae bacterium]|nr:YggS family pyridoxal phosphate-dependent enzyme [Leptospiraceae bacterium]MCP5511957.1 YggS family pyridoxal phosphate-dependent enzyme [Leptospiraceae bacterium]
MNPIDKILTDLNKEIYPAKLIAVSKTYPIETIRVACQSGQVLFGENRIQEGIEKFSILRSEGFPIELHHIGPVQSGTMKKLFKNFDYTHGVGSVSVLEKLSKESLKHESKLKFLIQLNLTSEDSKNGVTEKEFIEELSTIRNLQTDTLIFVGLMTMGPSSGDPIETENVFKNLKTIRDTYFPEGNLSMGMSGDYPLAIIHGANFVRIGSKIFGNRDYSLAGDS